MDIGKQQRVIIVEVDEVMAGPAAAGEPASVEEPARTIVLPDPGGAWPLPLALDPDLDPVPADGYEVVG